MGVIEVCMMDAVCNHGPWGIWCRWVWIQPWELGSIPQYWAAIIMAQVFPMRDSVLPSVLLSLCMAWHAY